MRLVIGQDDKTARVRCKQLGIELVVSDGWEVRGPTLFARAPVPWDLVRAGFEFLARWDAAAPLWRYGVLAETLGSKDERKRTKEITRDLRLLVHAPELLFVADTELGRALVETWRRECGDEPGNEFLADEHSAGRPPAGTLDERLAFVRALYVVKPRFCTLPRSWLAEETVRAVRDVRASEGRRKPMAQPLVTVQVRPGVAVKCKPGDEGAVLKRYQMMLAGREEKKRR